MVLKKELVTHGPWKSSIVPLPTNINFCIYPSAVFVLHVVL